MWIYFMLVGAVLSASADVIKTVIDEGDFFRTDQMFLKQIVPPSGYSSYGNDNKTFQLSYMFPKENKYYSTFKEYVEKGITMKGLTFNIYDDKMRNAAIALFKLIRNTRKDEKFNFINLTKWIHYNVNSDMVDYASRLASLFDTSTPDEKFLPPFLVKPNYFVGGETIFKAFYFSDKIGKVTENVMKTYQILNIDENSIAINTNYSGWNMPPDACDKLIKYYTEDIALNSHYYGLQLLHPFWMTNEELAVFNPRHAEHYYFSHKQLYARYQLEEEHLQADVAALQAKYEPQYNPYLYYDNGLPFPSRCATIGDDKKNDDSYLKTKDSEIKESIHRGKYTENGTLVELTEDNYINLVAKLVRSKMNNIKNAKIARNVYGYRASGYPINKYNPAPSILNHAQTTLREPIYWYLIKKDLDYFSLYANNTGPYDISKYERNDFTISNIETTTVLTKFQYYLINLYKSLDGDLPLHEATAMPNVYARQRRLNHEPFTLKFTIESKLQKDVTIRLFLGPSCSINNCWALYYKFFQLDCYRYNVKVTGNISNKPLGFPFHRQADVKTVNANAKNYRFYNILVFHKASPADNTGYFSPHIY
ncbi:hypothetical protein evm_000474 [Chilo suppressalis]|nr:hypothetical protein evm_000474 [Chilo suppressalis]